MMPEKGTESQQKRPVMSVIVPVHNMAKSLRSCLDALFASNFRSFECIVVDDCSTDDSLRIAQRSGARTIGLTAHKGAAFGRNRGAEAASGDILVFIDADVVVYPDTLDKLHRALEENAAIAAVFGSYDDKPESANFLSQYKNLFHHYIHQTSRRDAETFWTACGAVRTTCFREIGGFDETRRMMEDIDLGYRLKARNYSIRLEKDIVVRHLKRYSLISLVKSDLLDRAIPWTMLILSRGGAPNDLNLKKGHKWSALLVLLVILCLPLTAISLWFLAGFLAAAAAFFLLNREFYHFYIEKRGLAFTLKVVPFHFLYYLYGTLGFAIGFTLHWFRRGAAASRRDRLSAQIR